MQKGDIWFFIEKHLNSFFFQPSSYTSHFCKTAYYGQSMTVPSKPSLHVKPTLLCPASNHVFNSTSQDMTIMGKPCSKGWTIVECIPGIK